MDLEAGGSLDIGSHRGEIDLIPWQRPEVHVEARIEAPPGLDAPYADQIVEATQVRVGGGGSAVFVHTDHGDVPPPPEGRRRRWLIARSQAPRVPAVAYRIHAPQRLHLRVQDHASTVRAGAFEGELEIVTHAGDVTVEGFVGELRVVSHKGRTEVLNLEGRLQVASHSGSLGVRRVRLTGPSRIETHRGEVDFAAAEGAGFTLMARLGERAAISGALPADGGLRPDGVRAVAVAGGGPALWLVSYKGRIRVGAD